MNKANPYEIGKGAAKQIGIPPQAIDYIEARGFLCHELLYLLRGRIDFVFTPSWRFFRRLADRFFGVYPLCRWYPPEGTILELVGYYAEHKTKVYRLVITESDKVVFFVENQPEAPIGFREFEFPYNVPTLVQNRFLRPPFKNNIKMISNNLRDSVNRHEHCYEPIATEEEINSWLHIDETNKGLWDGFTQL